MARQQIDQKLGIEKCPGEYAEFFESSLFFKKYLKCVVDILFGGVL